MLRKTITLFMFLFLYSIFSYANNGIDHMRFLISDAGCDSKRLKQIEEQSISNIELQNALNKQRWLCDKNQKSKSLKVAYTSNQISPLNTTVSVDITPPEFRGLEFSTNSIDVSSGTQTITLKVYVYEAESEPNLVSL
ncbi:hypothetical protein, partial [Aliiglaciecola aliphaticivorans]